LHDKAPWGVVQSRMEFKVERGGNPRERGIVDLKMLEITQNSKSELPDEK
jgi:hypothetical protein